MKTIFNVQLIADDNLTLARLVTILSEHYALIELVQDSMQTSLLTLILNKENENESA